MVLRLEDSEEYAHLLGKYELLYNKVKTVEEIMAVIEKVEAADLERVARDLFKTEKMYLAAIGPYEDQNRFSSLMKL